MFLSRNGRRGRSCECRLRQRQSGNGPWLWETPSQADQPSEPAWWSCVQGEEYSFLNLVQIIMSPLHTMICKYLFPFFFLLLLSPCSPALPHAVHSVLSQVTDLYPLVQEATGVSTSIMPTWVMIFVVVFCFFLGLHFYSFYMAPGLFIDFAGKLLVA